MTTEEGEEDRRYQVEESDLAEADRNQHFLRIMSLLGPEFADERHGGLLAAIDALAEFPGPRSHPVVRERTSERPEIRRALYYGPRGRQGRNHPNYRVLFYIVEPESASEPGVVRVLRILHSSQSDA